MPIIEKAIYITICTATIVEPTGVLAKIEVTIPTREQKTDKTTEHTVTDLKLLNKHIADSDGKTISAEIKREPTRFIARTIITATITAIKRL